MVKLLQMALNSFFKRYDLHQPPLAVDGIYGPVTKRQSHWAQWLLGYQDAQIGHWDIRFVIWTLLHPSAYFLGGAYTDSRGRRRVIHPHPGGYKRHRARLALVRGSGGLLGHYAFPVSGPLSEGRTDRGQDLETQVGAHIHAIDSGRITRAGDGDVGLGQIVGRMLHPWRGWGFWYCFHLRTCYVNENQWVNAGDVIAVSDANPPDADGMPGHIEYGFCLDGAGSIQAATDGTHYTSSGQDAHDLFHLLDPRRVGQPAIIA